MKSYGINLRYELFYMDAATELVGRNDVGMVTENKQSRCTIESKANT